MPDLEKQRHEAGSDASGAARVAKLHKHAIARADGEAGAIAGQGTGHFSIYVCTFGIGTGVF